MRISWEHYHEWLGDLAPEFVAPAVTPPQPAQINRDSRTIQPGDMYIALKGESFDGHGFINHAVDAGAGCFLYEDATKVNPENLTRGIRVTSTIGALQRIGQGYLQQLDIKKVAITGSVGKTTCKQLLGSILARAGETLASQASFNNEIGVPLTMLQVQPPHKFVVFECGARHPGDIKFLIEMIKPDVALTLNAQKVHLAEFGSFAAVVQTKTEMFRYAPPKAVLVAPQDQPMVANEARACGNKVVSFGSDRNADVCILATSWNDQGQLTIKLRLPTGELAVKMQEGHDALAINAAAAAAAAHALGISSSCIAEGLSQFEASAGRFKIHKLKEFVVIDDAYNASPYSMESGFRTCHQLYPEATNVVILGDMLELGDESKALHHKVGRQCFEILQPDLIITIGEESREAAAGAIAAGQPKDKILSFDSVEQASKLPTRIFTKRDVIYLKGSNGMRLRLLVDQLLQWGQGQT